MFKTNFTRHSIILGSTVLKCPPWLWAWCKDGHRPNSCLHFLLCDAYTIFIRLPHRMLLKHTSRRWL